MRVRARFTKLGKVRFTSHRDVARMWERALRKAAVPIAYTEGFSPRPKLHFGLALGTSYESMAEYLDIDLDPSRLGAARPDESGFGGHACPALVGPDLAGLGGDVSAALPEGVDVTALAELEPGSLSLQQAVTSCTWRIELDGAPEGRLDRAVDAALRAPELIVTRERKGQRVTDDLRPFILSLRVETAPSGRPALLAELGTQPRAVRPPELLAVIDGDLAERAVCRLQQWITHEGARCEPLVAAADATRVRTLVPDR